MSKASAKARAFNLTPKRIQALRFIKAHPRCLVGYVAQEVLAKTRPDGSTRPMWSQAATRNGAGYCKQLQTEGLVLIDTYSAHCGYGHVSITPEGDAKLRELDAAADTLDAVVGRCVQ